jgi:hypothetical protein
LLEGGHGDLAGDGAVPPSRSTNSTSGILTGVGLLVMAALVIGTCEAPSRPDPPAAPPGIARLGRAAGHDEPVPQSRSIRLRRSQIIWLIAIIAVGVIVGIVAGLWWGLGAAAIVLAISEVNERTQRARR